MTVSPISIAPASSLSLLFLLSSASSFSSLVSPFGHKHQIPNYPLSLYISIASDISDISVPPLQLISQEIDTHHCITYGHSRGPYSSNLGRRLSATSLKKGTPRHYAVIRKTLFWCSHDDRPPGDTTLQWFLTLTMMTVPGNNMLL